MEHFIAFILLFTFAIPISEAGAQWLPEQQTCQQKQSRKEKRLQKRLKRLKAKYARVKRENRRLRKVNKRLERIRWRKAFVYKMKQYNKLLVKHDKVKRENRKIKVKYDNIDFVLRNELEKSNSCNLRGTFLNMDKRKLKRQMTTLKKKVNAIKEIQRHYIKQGDTLVNVFRHLSKFHERQRNQCLKKLRTLRRK